MPKVHKRLWKRASEFLFGLWGLWVNTGGELTCRLWRICPLQRVCMYREPPWCHPPSPCALEWTGVYSTLGSIAPGSRSMAQSHVQCGGNFVAPCFLYTSWSAGVPGVQGHWRDSFGCRFYSIGGSRWYPIWLWGNFEMISRVGPFSTRKEILSWWRSPTCREIGGDRNLMCPCPSSFACIFSSACLWWGKSSCLMRASEMKLPEDPGSMRVGTEMKWRRDD